MLPLPPLNNHQKTINQPTNQPTKKTLCYSVSISFQSLCWQNVRVLVHLFISPFLGSLLLTLNYISHNTPCVLSLTELHSHYPRLLTRCTVDGASQPAEQDQCKKHSNYNYREHQIFKRILFSSITFSCRTALWLAIVWDPSETFKLR